MFKDVIKQMVDDGEDVKIINNARGKDKKRAKEFFDAFKDADFERTPEIIFIQACKSYSIWQDAFVYRGLMAESQKSLENLGSVELKKLRREINQILSSREMKAK